MTKNVDICLLLEGTYPYVRGGVSSWVDKIITGLPEFTFHIIFLGGHPDFYQQPAYQLPDNVVGLEMHYLLADIGHTTPKAHTGNYQHFQYWNDFLSFFETNKAPIPGDSLKEIAELLGKKGQLNLRNFLYSRASWDVLTTRYLQAADNQPFVNYFWTYRNIYQPLFILTQIVQNLPNASVYHSISTGYAGFLGALCRQKTNRPLLLTEHGIYTKERKIDLAQVNWINEQNNLMDISIHQDMDLTRKTWIQFFEQLGNSAYAQADHIIALFEGNRLRQHSDGASEDKTQVIANGIDIGRFASAYQRRPKVPPMVVGLVGRVVPIKDIKTFIRTLRNALNTLPSIEGWIIGPSEEDPAYVDECKLLIDSLGLDQQVKLLGNQDVAEIMPKLGVMMLTSISEAQPLVLLEAMAAGIPCVATEVGSCREIIEGGDEQDRALGSCGEIIAIASPNEGANAIIRILSDASAWQRLGDVGKARVSKYYDEKLMFAAYRHLYEGASSGRNRL